MSQIIQLPKQEYADIMDCMERMKETIDILSDEESVKKIKQALERIESGEFLTKEELIL